MQPSPNLNRINRSISRISNDVTAKDMLLQFDKVLEDSGVYAYANWYEGELVEGPEVSRYWFETTWMWPEKFMPDPDAGLRLTKKGCKVYFYKDTFLQTADITGPESFKDTARKSVKEIEHPVWCVKIQMPRRLIDDEIMDMVDLESIVSVDTSESDAAYDQPPADDVNEQQTDDMNDEFDNTDEEF